MIDALKMVGALLCGAALLLLIYVQSDEQRSRDFKEWIERVSASSALAATTPAVSSPIVCPWSDGLIALVFSADRSSVTIRHSHYPSKKTLPVVESQWSLNADRKSLRFVEDGGAYLYRYEYFESDELRTLSNWRTEKASGRVWEELMRYCSTVEELQ